MSDWDGRNALRRLTIVFERLAKLPQMLPALAKFEKRTGMIHFQALRFFESLNGTRKISHLLESTCKFQPHAPILRHSVRPLVPNLDIQTLIFARSMAP